MCIMHNECAHKEVPCPGDAASWQQQFQAFMLAAETTTKFELGNMREKEGRKVCAKAVAGLWTVPQVDDKNLLRPGFACTQHPIRG